MTRVVGLLGSTVLALAWAGCSDDPPVCAQATESIVTASPLSLARDVTLARVGDGFALAAATGNTVRWARMDAQGVLSGETSFTLPVSPATLPDGQPLGPYLAITGKAAAADQLVAIMGVARTDAADQYDVLAFTQTAGSTAAPVQTTLNAAPLAVAPTSGALRIVTGSSATGLRGLVAWGVEGQAAPVSYVILGADGAVLGRNQIFKEARVPLMCLREVDGAKAFAVSALEDSGASQTWRIVDIDESGAPSEGGAFSLDEVADDCRLVSSTMANTHFVAWQNRQNGTFFAAYYLNTGKVVSKLVMGVSGFGAYAMMPKVAWIAPIGNDVTIGLARNNGPEVVRFDLFANPKGRSLHLPSVQAETGPVSAWVGPDTTYVTYLDQGDAADAGPQDIQRYLVAVQAPAKLP